MNLIYFCPSMMLLVATGLATAGGTEENPLCDLRKLTAEGEEFVLSQPTEAEVFGDRHARLSLGHLRRDRPVVVLAIDRFGVKVRGFNRAGQVTGWIGRRQAMGDDPAGLATLERFYQRLVLVERLIANGQPAVGMSPQELERALGKASTRRLELADGRQMERMEWLREESVPLLTGLPGLARDEPLLTLTRETGRLTAVVVGGVATSVEVSEGGRRADKIPSVPPPCPVPFGVQNR